MSPINCVSKSRSFLSDLLNVAMNSPDKGNEETSATPLTHQLLKFINLSQLCSEGFPSYPKSPHRRCETSRSWPQAWEPEEVGRVGRRGVLAAAATWSFSVSCLYLHNFSQGKIKLRALVAKLSFKKASGLDHQQSREFCITSCATILDQQQLNEKAKLHWQKILHTSQGTRFCLETKISKSTASTIIKNKHY